jgi:hypothetical protein
MFERHDPSVPNHMPALIRPVVSGSAGLSVLGMQLALQRFVGGDHERTVVLMHEEVDANAPQSRSHH